MRRGIHITLKYERKRMRLSFMDVLSDVLLFFVLMQLLPPQGIADISPAIQRLAHFKIVTAFGVSFVFIIQVLVRRRVDRHFIAVMVLPAVAGLLTIVNGVWLYGWASNYLTIVLAAFVVQLNKANLVKLIRVFRFYLMLLILLNLISILLYPNGMYASRVYSNYNWLLGYKSSIQCYMVPYICLEWLYSCYGNKKIRFTVMLSLCVMEAILSSNSMLTVGMLLISLFWVFNLPKRLSVFGTKVYAAAYGTINVLFLFFINLLSKFDFFNGFLALFGKTLSLSGRVSKIWPKAIRYISERWLLGHGVYSGQTYMQLFGASNLPHAHNQILQIMLDGGIILLSVYALWFLYLFSVLNKFIPLKSSQIILSCTFAVYLMSTVEVFIYTPAYFGTWLVMIMGLYSKEIDRQFRELSGNRQA